jgi:hypothetical protein
VRKSLLLRAVLAAVVVVVIVVVVVVVIVVCITWHSYHSVILFCLSQTCRLAIFCCH